MSGPAPRRSRPVGSAALTLALAGAVAVAVVGALRQRREQREVAAGALPPATATADVPQRVVYGPLAARLADWVPSPPATPLGRLAAALWSGPLTLVGFALALLAGRRPRWDPARRCFVTTDVGGISRVVLRMVGMDANAVGSVVLSIRPVASDALLAHEAVHTRQAERLGLLMPVVYAWLAARYGYRDHPLERAARLGARRVIEKGQGLDSGGASASGSDEASG
jgi:hypothetical protein